MGGMKDHYFGDRYYPTTPGFKAAPGPSVDAAQAIGSRAETLRAQVLVEIQRKPQTADEVAAELGESVLAIRPRVSELFAKGKIEKTAERHANASGIKATVWRAAPRG